MNSFIPLIITYTKHWSFSNHDSQIIQFLCHKASCLLQTPHIKGIQGFGEESFFLASVFGIIADKPLHENRWHFLQDMHPQTRLSSATTQKNVIESQQQHQTWQLLSIR